MEIGFVEILFVQTLFGCGLILASVYVDCIRNCFETEVSVHYLTFSFLAVACILLRVFSKSLLCLLLNTVAVSAVGCQLAVWLCASDNRDELERGQVSVLLACGAIAISFVIIQFIWLKRSAVAGVASEPDALKVAQAVMQSTVIVCFVFGAAIVAIDDRVWEWRYAYAVLLSAVASAYLNGFAAYYLQQKQGSSFTVCSKIILQPLLLVEGWLVSMRRKPSSAS